MGYDRSEESGVEEELCFWTHQSPLRLDERSVNAIHLVVQSTGITQVVARTISPPQRGGHSPAVNTLTTLRKVIIQI